jgi:tRNA-specific 2-thiouridylase
MFPIGMMAKGEVRRIAEEAKLPSAHRKDSQGICFLGKIDYNQFIERFLGKKEGPIVEIETGKILGRHQGFWFHTIGQRKGLYLSGGPWFVVKKDINENIIYVSKGYQPEAQMKDELVMRDMHWITLNPYAEQTKIFPVANDEAPVLFKIRHVAELRSGRLTRRADGSYHLQMDAKTNGVAPGQFCVIYTPDGRICLGSGEIAWE